MDSSNHDIYDQLGIMRLGYIAWNVVFKLFEYIEMKTWMLSS